MAVIEIENFRKKYPDYNDMDDATLASRLAEKYPDAYGDLPGKVNSVSSPVILKPKENIVTNVYSPDFLSTVKDVSADPALYKKSKNALSIAAMHDISPDAAFIIHDEYAKKIDESNIYDKAVGSFKAGWGDIYSSIGGILKRKNIGGTLGDTYIEFGEKLKHAYIPPSDQSEFTWRKLVDPEWYATTAMRSVPFTMSLAPAAVIGAYVGAAAAGAVGLGAFGTTVLGSIGGSSLARPVESAFEAQGAFEEAKQKGMSDEEAEAAASQVFWDNMKLSGLDAAEFATAFLPMGKVAGNTAKRALSKRILAATGKLTGVGIMEAAEERYQEKAVMDAVGDPVSFFNMSNPRLNEASAAGAIFGIGLGGTGSVWKALTDKVTKTMPEPVKQVYEQAKEQGMSDIQALDVVAETPEGKQHIETVIQDMKDLAEGKEPKLTVQDIQKKTEAGLIFDEAALDEEIDRVFSEEKNIEEITLSELNSDALLEGEQGNESGEGIQTQIAQELIPKNSIIDNLNLLNNQKGSIDLEPLVDIGRTVWNEGKQTYDEFVARIKEIVGDMWEKVQPYLKEAWNILANERGSISNKPLYDAVKKAGGLDPDKIKSSYNFKDDIRAYGLTGLTKKGGVALDDLATELQGKGILGETPDTFASPGDYLLAMLKDEKQKQVKETITRLTAEEKEAISEIEGQWREEGISEEEINRRVAEALEITSDKEAGRTKGASKNDLVKKLRELRSVTPTSKVKTVIRRNTGQVSLARLVREDEALRAAFKKAEQTGRIAFREGNKAGIAKAKEDIKEMIRKAAQKEAQRESTARDIKAIQRMAEMKGNIAVDYQKKIKEFISGYDFTTPTEETRQRLQNLADYIENNGVPLGINPKRISELKRLSLIPLKKMDADTIREIRNQLENLTQLGKLKAQMKYKYKERERVKILKRIIDTTNNLDPDVMKTEDRFRDRMKVAGINFYLDTLHTPRVADMADQFKDYQGPQAKLIKETGQAETEAVATSMQRGIAFLEYLQNEGIEIIPEESESDIRMHIVMRYREGARAQAQTLMDHYGIKELPTLTETEEKIIEYIRKDMEANKGKLAAVWEEIENEIFPEQDVYYLPLKYVKEEDLIPELQTEGRGRTTHTFDGFSHARRPGVKKLPRVGVLQIYQEAVLEQEWYTHIQPVIADIKSIILTDEYKETAGEVLYNWWKDGLDILARRGWSASAQLNSLSSLMRAVRHNVNTAILAFKASTVIMQPFAVFDGMAYVNAHYGTRAAGKVLTETTKNFIIPGTTNEIVAKSDALQQRQGGELAITEEMKQAKGEGIKDKLTRIGFNLISKADVKTAAGTQEAVKKVFFEQGLSEDEAQKEAEFVMNMSQGSSSIAYRPHILAKGEGARTWFTFQTFIMNRWGLLVHDLVIGKIVKDDFKKKLAGLISIGILMMAGAAEDEAREWLYNLTHKKDLNEDKRSIPEIVLVNLSSTMPFFGNIIEAASMNRDAYPPAMKTIMTGSQGIKQLFSGKDAESRFKGALKATETGLTLGLGYPGTAQFFDVLEATLAMNADSEGGRK